MKVLVTGAACFIGMHVSQLLLERGDRVVGLDNLNGYYDPELKLDRLTRLAPHANFRFVKQDVAEREGMAKLFAQERFDRVVHLAAQAGVRYSLVNPYAYIDSNIAGFTNILEGCRHHAVQHLVYASSSSVYGGNTAMPFSEHHNVDHPVSLYAATKKANELMAHTYSHLFRLPTTGLRLLHGVRPLGPAGHGAGTLRVRLPIARRAALEIIWAPGDNRRIVKSPIHGIAGFDHHPGRRRVSLLGDPRLSARYGQAAIVIDEQNTAFKGGE